MSRRAVLFALVAALGVGGCFTPSIPIPPPDPELMTFDVEIDPAAITGTASFSYPADANYVGSVVYVYDSMRGVGVISKTNPDGSVSPTMPFTAALGDPVEVSFQREDQTVSTCIVLRDGAQSGTSYCP